MFYLLSQCQTFVIFYLRGQNKKESLFQNKNEGNDFDSMERINKEWNDILYLELNPLALSALSVGSIYEGLNGATTK